MQYLTLTLPLLIFCFKGTSQTNIQLILSGGNHVTKVYARDVSFKEDHSTNFKDTINFHFIKTNKIDLYNIGCFINNKQPWKQVWLNSGNIRLSEVLRHIVYLAPNIS